MNIIEQIEKEQLRDDIPEFSPGDTVAVQVRIREGERERLQIFEGVVIAKKNRGLNSSFTVRKMSFKPTVNSLPRLRSNVKAMFDEQNSTICVREAVNLPELKKKSNPTNQT